MAAIIPTSLPPQDLREEKSEWDHTQDKIKLLNKLVSDGAIPLEMFNSDVRLMKQGPLTQVVGKKETFRHCILFNTYIALAQTKDNQYKIMEVCVLVCTYFLCAVTGKLLESQSHTTTRIVPLIHLWKIGTAFRPVDKKKNVHLTG